MTNSSIAFLFPGQGSQAVGMGGALAASHAAAKQVFEEVNDALGENLFAIMQDGPDDAIRMTRNAQPALFATSMAAVRVIEAELGAPLTSRGGMAAGHSLGEYAALAASGSLSISDAARLLRQRGDSMQSAVPVGEGAMAAILGGDEDQINAILADAKSSGLSRSPTIMPRGKSSLAAMLARLMRRLRLPRQPDCGGQSNCLFQRRFIVI